VAYVFVLAFISNHPQFLQASLLRALLIPTTATPAAAIIPNKAFIEDKIEYAWLGALLILQKDGALQSSRFCSDAVQPAYRKVSSRRSGTSGEQLIPPLTSQKAFQEVSSSARCEQQKRETALASAHILACPDFTHRSCHTWP
jgi:hypothetical protein